MTNNIENEIHEKVQKAADVMESLGDLIIELAASAHTCYDMYEALKKAIIVKYGTHDAEVLIKAALMSALQDKINEVGGMTEDD